jgi:hypothetical protein
MDSPRLLPGIALMFCRRTDFEVYYPISSQEKLE